MIDIALVWQSLPALLKGTYLTVQITAASAALGLTLGVLLACVERSQIFLLARGVKIYVTIFRGTPLLIQILFIYYVLPEWGIYLNAVTAAILGLGLNSGAYISQIVRSGMQSVSKGQVEAAVTLGFSPLQIMRHVILPQAFLVMVPALASELSTLIKESSLASIIGVMELSKEASLIRSRTYDAFSLLLASAMIYFVLITGLAYCMKKIEKRWGIHARSSQPI